MRNALRLLLALITVVPLLLTNGPAYPLATPRVHAAVAPAPRDQTSGITYTQLPSGSTPGHIIRGANGDMWLALSWNAIGRVAPGGTVTRYTVPAPRLSPGNYGQIGGLALGRDGNIWFTFSVQTYDAQGYTKSHLKVGRITPSGSIKEFSLPSDSLGVAGGIAASSDGNFYFTGLNGNDIGRIMPNGIVTQFPLPAYSDAFGIASDLQGNIWFTELHGDRIGRLLPTGALRVYDLPSGFHLPASLALGRDGNMWFTVTSSLGEGDQRPPAEGRIDRITPDGRITEFRLPGSDPSSVAAAPDGSLWSCSPNQLDRLTIDGSVTEFRVVGGSYGCSLAAAADGSIWFTEPGSGMGSQLGRLVPPVRIQAVTVGSFYTSQKSSYDAWKTDASLVPFAMTVFPATTANIAYYLSYAGAAPGVSRFQVRLRDSTGAIFSSGPVHLFAHANGSFMAYFYNLPSYPPGNYTIDLLVNGSLLYTSHFTVAAQ